MRIPKPRPASTRRRLPRFETLEGRRMLSAVPLGAMPRDTAEFMLGTVAVTPILLESDGSLDASTENWTSDEIQRVLDNLRTGLDWWVDTLATFDTPHTLEFVVDSTYATTPVATPYEPISRPSYDHAEYVGRFLADRGYASGGSLEDAIRDFNHDQRVRLGTNWAFTVFIVDASNDADGMFAPGGFSQAFAFAGGQFFVTPSGRPASTYAHETGHMFWARDEYSGGGHWSEHRGYYNTQNTNSLEGRDSGFVQEPSIMSAGLLLRDAYDSHTSAAATLAHVGWQDSDGDGIFDVLDVPMRLEAATWYNAADQTLHIRGSAEAVPLPNRNSSGLGNDITLNRISRIEYRIDGGEWLIAATPNRQQTDVDLVLAIPAGFSTVEIRGVDAVTGIATNTLVASATAPSVGGGSIDGFAFVDADGDGEWDPEEMLLPGVSVAVVSGPDVYRGRIEPDDRAGTIYLGPQQGFQIQARGNTVAAGGGRVAAFEGTAATGRASFFAETLTNSWSDQWTAIKQELWITLDHNTTDASIIAIGKQASSYARLEAYDVNGALVARETVGPLAIGATATLRVSDPEGRIRSIRAFGHAGTSVALDDFRFGPAVATTSSTFGTWGLEELPAGTYQVRVEPPSRLYKAVVAEHSVTVSADGSARLAVAMQRLASPWTNPGDPFDVNDNGQIQPIDALIIINDLNRSGPRPLGEDAANLPFLDVNGDMSVSPIDALQVINYLNRQSSGASGESRVTSGVPTAQAPPPGAMDFAFLSAAADPEGEASLNERHDARWESAVDVAMASLGGEPRERDAGDVGASEDALSGVSRMSRRRAMLELGTWGSPLTPGPSPPED